MITDAVINRHTHIASIHQLDMALQTIDVTDVTRVNNKGSLLVIGIIAETPCPGLIAFNRTNFSIRNLDETMIPLAVNRCGERFQSEIIGSNLCFNLPIITV